MNILLKIQLLHLIHLFCFLLFSRLIHLFYFNLFFRLIFFENKKDLLTDSLFVFSQNVLVYRYIYVRFKWSFCTPIGSILYNLLYFSLYIAHDSMLSSSLFICKKYLYDTSVISLFSFVFFRYLP